MSKVAIITGCGGLIGSECVKYYAPKFDSIIGIDCDARKEFFGEKASVQDSIDHLKTTYPNFKCIYADISDNSAVTKIFDYWTCNPAEDVKLIIHTAAQPSHDLAAQIPHRDFMVNAVGTLNLLEATRTYCPEAVFIFTSTNKVYGDRPNTDFHYVEMDKRYEVMDTGVQAGYSFGINEKLSIDNTTHSLFGVSKASADLMVQEYGKYFGLKTGIFRGGCLTGPNHKGAEQHGFLSYLCYCIKHEKPYTIYGYQGKQVRDIIHAYDVVTAFDEFYKNPTFGEVYNLGGGRHSNCSMWEAISIIENKTGKKASWTYNVNARKGDHKWYISDMSKFRKRYTKWNYKYNLDQIIDEILEVV